jgi:serine/threonine-protein kinase
MIAPESLAGEPTPPAITAQPSVLVPPAPSSAPTGESPRSGVAARAPTCLGGRYEVLGLLGTGGMGAVYKARDLELDELVAVKMLSRDLLGSALMLDRFRREVKLARRVTHPNVARTFDIGEHQGERYLTMELIDGESLAALLARQAPLSLLRIVELAEPMCAGLGAAHAAGVIHRDLKPENVLVDGKGRVVITDFGIARAHLESGAVATQHVVSGTPAYMAPEQVEAGGKVDMRSDIYALGAILFEMATGRRAWAGDAAIAVAAARLVRPPPDPRHFRARIGDGLAELVLRCMARNAAERPATAVEVAATLRRLLAEDGSRAGSDPGMSSSRSTPRGSLAPALSFAGAGTGVKTVAVLPFKNGGPPGDDYLAEGLTDELIDTLSMTRGLRVRSHGTVHKLRGETRDPRDIGRELEVQVVVEGSIRRAGEQLRISARLSSVADGFQLWAKRFDRPAADLLVVGDEVARAVADALTVDSTAPAREAPSDPVVVELYLRGRHEYRKFWQENCVAAVSHFQQALARAPEDATIKAACAMAASRVWFFGGPGAEASGQLARRLAQEAIQRAPGLAEAHMALAIVRFHEGDSESSVREARLALASAPANADAHALIGRILLEVGPIAEAIRRSETALSLESDTAIVCTDLARAHALLGDWEASDRYLARSRRLGEHGATWFVLMRLLMWRGDRTGVEAAVGSAAAAPEETSRTIGGALRAVLAGKVLPSQLVAAGPFATPGGGVRRGSFYPQMGAELASFVGNHDEVVRMVQLAVDSGLLDVVWLDSCPLLAGLRSDARFSPLRAEVAARAARVSAAYRK